MRFAGEEWVIIEEEPVERTEIWMTAVKVGETSFKLFISAVNENWT